MKLYKGERRVYSKFAETKRAKEKEFYGLVTVDGKDRIITTFAGYLGEATRLLEEKAKENGYKLTLVRAFQ